MAAEISEYERAVTTCANAYVQPLIDAYLHRLESALATRGFGGRLHMMHSAGGLISLDAARAFPIRPLESGPPAAPWPPRCSASWPASTT